MSTLKDRFPTIGMFFALVAMTLVGIGTVQIQYNAIHDDGYTSMWFFISGVILSLYAYRISDFRSNRVRRLSRIRYSTKSRRSSNGSYYFDNPPARSFRSTKEAKKYSSAEIQELNNLR